MKPEAMLAAALTIGAVGAARAEDRAADAPARLADALRAGTVDAQTAAEITRWVFSAEDDEVARGLLQALRSVGFTSRRADTEGWNATARAMANLFDSALRDAADHERRDPSDWPELTALVDAATPEVVKALEETDPAARQLLMTVLREMARIEKRTGPAEK